MSNNICPCCEESISTKKGLKIHVSTKHLTDEEKFWKRVNKKEEDECWEWTAGNNGKGYGTLFINGNQTLAHRYSYKLHKGDIKDNFVLHKCDNKACVNPRHLYLGDYSQNLQDAYDRNQREIQNGESNSRNKLTDDKVKEIKRRHKEGEYPSSIVNDFNVSQKSIEKVCYGRTWNHIDVEVEE